MDEQEHKQNATGRGSLGELDLSGDAVTMGMPAGPVAAGDLVSGEAADAYISSSALNSEADNRSRQRRPRRRQLWISWVWVLMILMAVGAGGFYYWYQEEQIRLQQQELAEARRQETFVGAQRKEAVEAQRTPAWSQGNGGREFLDFDQLDYQRKIRLRMVAESFVAQPDNVAVFYRTDAQVDPDMAMQVLDRRTITRGMQAVECFSNFQGQEKVSTEEKEAVPQSALDDAVLAQVARNYVVISEDVTAEVDSRLVDLRQSIADEVHFQTWAKSQYGSLDGLRKTITDAVLTERYLASQEPSRKALLTELYDTFEVLWEGNVGE